jgi:hypothetical protein
MHDKEPVVIIIEEPPPVRAVPADKPCSGRGLRWPSRTIGVALTIFVHLLVSTPFVLGVAEQKRRPSPDGNGITSWASQGEQYESMMLIDLSALQTGSEIDLALQSPEESPIVPNVPLILVSVEPSPPPDVTFEEDAAENQETAEAAGDPAGNAALFGKYMGQVAARIERAWMKPRTRIDAAHFDCRARVLQDRAGNVLSVGFESCSEDATWRRSLESAILRASPLSAPPEPWLFSAVLSLNFSADQYEAGRTPEYAQAPTQAPSPITNPPSGDIQLTITGTQIEWKKK